MVDKERNEQRYIAVESIEPNDWNPNVMSDDEYEELVDGIDTLGFNTVIDVVELTDGRFRILDGEHRHRAARELGIAEIPCNVLLGEQWEDEDLQNFTTMRHGVLRGDLDPVKFMKMFKRMAPKYGAAELRKLMGFTDRQKWDKLIGTTKKKVRKTLPKDMQKKVDGAFKEAKTMDDLTKIVRELYDKYGQSVIDMSFMVLTFGKREHLYIRMNADTKRAMDKVLDYCRVTRTDINEFVAPVIDVAAEEAAKKHKELTEEGAAF